MGQTMRLLITGALGNIGTSTLVALQGRGHRITCFDVPTRQNRRLAKRLFPDVRMYWGDIRSESDVAQAVVAHLLFHLDEVRQFSTLYFWPEPDHKIHLPVLIDFPFDLHARLEQ